MRVAIVGSRNFMPKGIVADFVRRLPEGTVVVSGGAQGVDTTAFQAAKEVRLERKMHLPDWERHGKAAGVIRNSAIVADCDVLVAFWDGMSAGTLDSINKARRTKRLYFVIKQSDSDKWRKVMDQAIEAIVCNNKERANERDIAGGACRERSGNDLQGERQSSDQGVDCRR